MSLADKIQTQDLSFEEFQRFAETHDGFWELDGGIPVKMESPSIEHQWISLEIAAAFRDYFKNKPCRAIQELDVWIGKRPFQETARKMKATVRKPDILVYCDKEQKKNGVILSPQLVVEIWSPSNTPKEQTKKLGEYYRAGVQEFWQIYCKEKEFSIFSFTGGTLNFLSSGSFHEPLESQYFPGLKADLSEYYAEFG